MPKRKSVRPIPIQSDPADPPDPAPNVESLWLQWLDPAPYQPQPEDYDPFSPGPRAAASRSGAGTADTTADGTAHSKRPGADRLATGRTHDPGATRRAWVALTARLDDAPIDDLALPNGARDAKLDFLAARRDWRASADRLRLAVGDREGAILARLKAAVGVEFLEGPQDLGVAASEAVQELIEDLNLKSDWLAFTVVILANGWSPRE